MCVYVTDATQTLQSHDLSGEGNNFGSHTYFFLSHKDMDIINKKSLCYIAVKEFINKL